jgi:hypothetical protein
MADSVYILLISDGGAYRLGYRHEGAIHLEDLPLEAKADATPEQVAEALAQSLREKGLAEAMGVLALPSQWCFCASMATEGLSKRNLRRQLLYRFEDYLPTPIEEMITDFVVVGDQVLGVAVAHERLDPLLKALANQRITLVCVAPAALMALQATLAVTPPSPPSFPSLPSEPFAPSSPQAPDLALLEHDLFLLQAGKPIEWYVLFSPEDLGRHVKLLSVKRPGILSAVCLASPPQWVQEIDGIVTIKEVPSSLDEKIVEFAECCEKEELVPWVQFHQQGISTSRLMRRVGKPLHRAILMLMVFLVVASLSLLWRGWRYDQMSRRQQAVQESLFREIFAGQAVPVSIRLRLESQDKKLSELAGALTESDKQLSSFTLLYETLRRLPPAGKYRLVELRLSDNQLYLEGQARSHAEAEAIAGDLKKQNGFEVEPPHSEQSGSGVSFSIAGSWPQASPAAGRGRP